MQACAVQRCSLYGLRNKVCVQKIVLLCSNFVLFSIIFLCYMSVRLQQYLNVMSCHHMMHISILITVKDVCDEFVLTNPRLARLPFQIIPDLTSELWCRAFS